MAGKNYVCGELIRLLRLFKGKKQKAIGHNCKITQQAISKLERSEKVSEKKFMEIAKAFNCSEYNIEAVKKFLPPPDNS